MALCLQADDYGPFFGYSEGRKTPQEECIASRKDIALLVVKKVSKVMPQYRIETLFEDMSPTQSFRIGYQTKQSWLSKNEPELPEWEYWEAVLRVHLSALSDTTADDLGYENWSLFEGDNIPELKKDKPVLVPEGNS